MKRILTTALGLALVAGMLTASVRPARAEEPVTTEKFDQIIRLITKEGERTTRLEDRATKVEDRVTALEQKVNGYTPSYVPSYSPPPSAASVPAKQVAYRNEPKGDPRDEFTPEERTTLAVFFDRMQWTGNAAPQTDEEWAALIKLMQVMKRYR